MTHRRAFLAGVGSISAAVLAGCLGGDDADGIDDAGGAGDSGGETLATHPVSADADEWPSRGPEFGEADATLVVFDDVSCPRCAAFHEQTLSKVQSEHVDDGEVSLVVRPYPVVYEWGVPAAHVLEAVYDRDAAAFWDLQAHYFADQGKLSTDNVFDRSESWLAANTTLDAKVVVADAVDEQYADRIDATLTAGENADAGGITPVTFAFSGDELLTMLTGSVSYTTIETALQL